MSLSTFGELSRRRQVFGVWVDNISQGEAVQEIMDWCRSGVGGIVVTPNLHHIHLMQKNKLFAAAYRKARLVLTDGHPLVMISKLDGGPAVQLVTGSDLIDPLCHRAAAEGNSLFLLGSQESVLERAASILKQRHPGLRIAGMYSPPFGFDQTEGESAKMLDALRRSKADIILLALGSPKGEIWAAEFFEKSGAKAILCIGASLDFIAGNVPRAPAVVRRVALEWLWRLAAEPKRLARRYVTLLILLPRLVVSHFVSVRRFGWGSGR